MLRCECLSKTYLSAGRPLTIFDSLELSVEPGERVAIVGESGSGKSTLLHLLGGLDRASSGRILFEGSDIAQYSAAQLADYRNRRIGFVWQIHHLLPEFTAAENVAMPLLIRGVSRTSARQKALTQLDRVGLAERAHHRSGELSGGEQQRVVLARALAGEPALLLADEPTGNLDTRTGERIFDLLEDLHRAQKLTTVLVTHNRQFAARCDRVLLLQNGILLPA
jgi:lipoprotein-releasing system ATP-binding protein